MATYMVHHEAMDTSSAPSKRESLACAAASLVLGGYLASTAQNLTMQVILLSFPPAALLVALRRRHHIMDNNVEAFEPAVVPATFEEVTAGLELDILTRAS
ncbi:MAG: hypothetical protein RLY24_920 [Actinomycetota bacterium]